MNFSAYALLSVLVTLSFSQLASALTRADLNIPEQGVLANDLRYKNLLSMPFFLEGEDPGPVETGRFIDAIIAYKNGGARENRYQPLEDYLEASPHSVFRLWIEGSMAKEMYRRGSYSESLAMWEKTWARTKGMFPEEPHKRANVSRIGLGLAELYARLGRRDQLWDLLQELDKYPFIGPDTEAMERVRGGFTMMNLRPEYSYNCGPYALANILAGVAEQKKHVKEIREVKGDGDGFSLSELEEIIEQYDLPYQVGFREEEGELVFPCVVHWRSDHYAAAIARRGGKVHIIDPTFRINKWIPEKDFLKEASGFFVIPSQEASLSGWRDATDQEREKISGRGAATGSDDKDGKCPKKPKDGKQCGMPYYGYDDFSVAHYIWDIPLQLESPFGPAMEFEIAFSASGEFWTAGLPTTELGTKWSHNFFSYLQVDTNNVDEFRVYLPGGQKETFLANPSPPTSSPYLASQRHRLSQSWLVGGISGGGYLRRDIDGNLLYYQKLVQTVGSFRYYYLLTSIVDAQGNTITIAYKDGPNGDGDIINYVEDSFGRRLLFEYPTNSYQPDRVVEVLGGQVVNGDIVGGTEYRDVHLAYDVNGHLNSITDAHGMTSTFNYDSTSDLSMVSSMTTPYGTTSFERGSFTRMADGTEPVSVGGSELIPTDTGTGNPVYYYRHLEITDPESLKESMLFCFIANTTIFPELVPGSIEGINAILYWDKKANKYHPPNFLTGKNFDFALESNWRTKVVTDSQGDNAKVIQPFIERVKSPLSSEIEFDPYDNDNLSIEWIWRDVEDRGATSGTEAQYRYFFDNVDDSGRVIAYSQPEVDTQYYSYTADYKNLVSAGKEGNTDYLYFLYDEFNSQNLPEKIYDASNNLTEVEYNSKGQPITVTKVRPSQVVSDYETFSITYGWPTGFEDPTPGSNPEDNDGFPTAITVNDPTNGISNVQILSLSYHSNTGYLHQVTETSTGITTTFSSYDELGRVTEITHEDGSTEEFSYEKDGSKYLDLMSHRNREGQWSRYEYNGNRQLVQMTDPEQRVMRMEWCSCGHIEALIDALGRKTEWKRDLIGRVTEKILPDAQKISYTYEPLSGRLDTITYPKDQGSGHASVDYDYTLRGDLYQVKHPGETDPFFARYEYEDLLGRVESAKWHDENGVEQTTTYVYADFLGELGLDHLSQQITPVPNAGKLITIDGPWADDTISYTYRDFNELLKQVITQDGASPTVDSYSEEYGAMDGLGRIHQIINTLGTFELEYSGSETRLDYFTGPGSFKVDFSYHPQADGGYLSQIKNTWGTGNTISQFDYTYRKDGKINTWKKLQGGNPADFMEFVYDLAGQLTQATQKDGSATGAIEKIWGFGYDRAGNRTSATVDDQPYLANFNDRNQMTSGDFSGTIPFIGKLDQWAEVTITSGGTSKRARVRPTEPYSNGEFLFESSVELDPSGTTQVDVVADDTVDPPTNVSYQINSSTAPDWATLQYDTNGNVTSRTVTKGGVTDISTYTWDPENRLKSVTRNGVTTEFVYNALGERVKIIENAQTATPTERRFLWCGGTQPCQERNSSNVVVKNYYSHGEEHINGISNTDYLYTKDHLGSIRELIDASTGIVMAVYDYSPFGIRESIGTPTVETELGFTGHFEHADSGLVLTIYRGYDAELGRWLSPDPLGEFGPDGDNLYTYVKNDPINYYDLLGLQRGGKCPKGLTEAATKATNEVLDKMGKKPIKNPYISPGAKRFGTDMGAGGRRSAYLLNGKIPPPSTKPSAFGPKISDPVPKNGVPKNWTKSDIADAISDYKASISSRKAELSAFDKSGRGSKTQRKAHARRISEEENFLKSLEKAACN